MTELNVGNFKNFKIEDRQIILPVLHHFNPKLSDYNFINLFIWSEQYDLKWMIYDNMLLIYDSLRDYCTMPISMVSTGNTQSTIPIESDVSIYLKISDQMIRQGKSGNFYLVDTECIDSYKEKFLHYFDLSIDESYSDYTYSSKKLIELKGSKLAKKKNLISQFQRNYPFYCVKQIDAKDLIKCIELAKLWCKITSMCNDPAFINEEVALKKSILYFNELQLDGLLLYSNSSPNSTNNHDGNHDHNHVCAFSIFSNLNKNTADIHFEKSDISIHGAAQVINWETAKYLVNKYQSQYQFLNREQDMGIKGLRQAKKSYAPEFIYRSYILKRKI